MQVLFKGNPLNLVGTQATVGQKAPEFSMLNASLGAVSLTELPEGVVLLNVVPSLDTPVCQIQSKQFYSKLQNMPVSLVTVSMDLPFAQARFCGAEGMTMQTLSDHRDASFGQAYGLLIQELRLLTRAVVVLDAQRNIRYMEIVPEVTQEPNYDAAMAALETLVAASV